ncbi:hypothetical protein LguiB_001346 [Lonicera macranthoides]
MGNAISPCCHPCSTSFVKLIFWEGTTRVLTGHGRRLAGEIMFEFPDRMVCHADSFFIGQPVPALAIDDELSTGQTYFVLPLDCFACNVVSASSFASLGSSPNKSTAPVNFKDCPFQYIKGSNGRVLIKVMPEFIVKLMTRGNKESEGHGDDLSPNNSSLCTTPELKKHYDMLVGSREQLWSPKLDTISEYNKIRFSPCKFIGLEWKQKNHDV